MTDKLNAVGSIQAGFSMADAVAGRKLQQQSLMQDQQKIDMLREESLYKQQQQAALQRLSAEAFNNPKAMTAVYAQNPKLGEKLAKERDRFNKLHYSAINNVTAQPPERQQAAWDMERAQLEAAGIDVSNISSKYSPEVAQQLQDLKSQLRTWDPVFESIDTARGIAAFDKTTGETRLTGDAVYVKPASTIINNINGENQIYKTARQAQGEIYGDIIKQGSKSASAIASLNRAEKLIDDIGETGKLTPAIAAVGNALNQLGVKVDTKKIGKIEQLTALSQEQVGKILSSGEYGTGTGISSTDLDAANKRVYSASATPEGNKLIISTLRDLEKRKQKAGRVVSRLLNEGKAEQIDAALDKLAEIPIFKEEEIIEAPKSSKNPEIKEGATITNKATGQRMKLVGGKWQPL